MTARAMRQYYVLVEWPSGVPWLVMIDAASDRMRAGRSGDFRGHGRVVDVERVGRRRR